MTDREIERILSEEADEEKVWEAMEEYLRGGGCMTLSDRMIEYRARENISQEELSFRAGVDRTTINKAETGKSVSRLTAAKIELVLRGEYNGEEEWFSATKAD